MKNNYLYQIEILGEPVYYDVFGAPCYEIGDPHFRIGKKTGKAYFGEDFLKYMRVCNCQACGKEFFVECTDPVYSGQNVCTGDYGDPPVHGCVGDTMGSVGLRELSKADKKRLVDTHIELQDSMETFKNVIVPEFNKLFKKYDREQPNP